MEFRRLRTQIILNFCGVMLAGGIFTTLLVRYTLSTSLLEASQERGHAIAEIMAHQLAQAIADEDWPKAQLLVDTESDHNAYVVLEAAGGRILSSAAGGSPAPSAASAVLGRSAPSHVELPHGPALDVPAQILGGSLGTVHVGVSLRQAETTTTRVLRDVALTTLAAMLAGVVGIFFLSGVITRPVTSLAVAARRMGEGRFDERAPVTGSNELAMLATTFNEMADEVQARIKASEELRDYFERILDHLNKAVLVCSPDGRLEYANDCGRRIFGVRPGDDGDSLFGDRGVLGSPWARERLAQGHVERRTVGLEDGRSFAVAIAALPRASGDQSVVISAADVTELQTLADRLRRTERIAAVGEVAAGIVHAVNNPLDGVRRALELAARHSDEPERMKQLLGYAQEGSDRIAEVTRNLLSFARADATESAQTIAPSMLVQEAAQLVALRADDRNVRLTFEADGACPEVRADPRALVDVLVNLLNNALDASPPGSTIRVITGRTARGDLELQVCDEGEGIALEVQKRIFEPFFTTKDPGQGTGLGLSMARRIVEAWGGEVAVQSAQGSGTCFFVRLPRATLGIDAMSDGAGTS